MSSESSRNAWHEGGHTQRRTGIALTTVLNSCSQKAEIDQGARRADRAGKPETECLCCADIPEIAAKTIENDERGAARPNEHARRAIGGHHLVTAVSDHERNHSDAVAQLDGGVSGEDARIPAAISQMNRERVLASCWTHLLPNTGGQLRHPASLCAESLSRDGTHGKEPSGNNSGSEEQTH